MSTVEEKELKWLKQFLLASSLFAFIWMGTNEVAFAYNLDLSFISGAILVLFTYWIAYKSITQQAIYQNINVEEVLPIIKKDPDSRYRNSPLNPEDIQRLKEQVVEAMEKSKPYLKSDLTLTNLAEDLHLNSKHLSQVLNEGFNENFYKFINRYRIEEAKRLLRSSIRLTLC